MSEVCRVTTELNDYLESQIVLDNKTDEKVLERLIDDQVNDLMSQDEEQVIEVLGNDDSCRSAVMDLCLVDCNRDLKEMSWRDIQTLALNAYKLNNRIAKAARSYVEASQ